jgi:hypothetical protein
MRISFNFDMKKSSNFAMEKDKLYSLIIVTYILIKVLRLEFNKMDDSELRRTLINLDEHELELSLRFRTFEP